MSRKMRWEKWEIHLSCIEGKKKWMQNLEKVSRGRDYVRDLGVVLPYMYFL